MGQVQALGQRKATQGTMLQRLHTVASSNKAKSRNVCEEVVKLLIPGLLVLKCLAVVPKLEEVVNL